MLLTADAPGTKIASLIQQRGIDFQSTPQVLEEFRKSGADKAVLAALQRAWHAPAQKPLGEKEIRMLLAADAPSEKIANLVLQRGIDFVPTPGYLEALRSDGAKDALFDVLSAAGPFPFSREEIMQLLAARMDQKLMVQMVRQRGIEFEAGSSSLMALRKAGAQDPLLEAIRTARHIKPAVAQVPPPRADSLTLSPGSTARLICDPADKQVPVLSDPNDMGTIAAQLRCGSEVTFLGKVDSPPGFDKIRYADGKEGYVSSSYLEQPVATVGGDVTKPSLIYSPQPGYTPEAQREQVQGTVTLQIVVDEQGKVADVQETSRPLGAGLDQRAMETVRTWRFNPATRNGVPVAVRVMVDVRFRLYRDGGGGDSIPSSR